MCSGCLVLWVAFFFCLFWPRVELIQQFVSCSLNPLTSSAVAATVSLGLLVEEQQGTLAEALHMGTRPVYSAWLRDPWAVKSGPGGWVTSARNSIKHERKKKWSVCLLGKLQSINHRN